MKKQYNFSLSDEAAKILKDYSEQTGFKMTTVVEKLIVKHLKGKKHEDV